MLLTLIITFSLVFAFSHLVLSSDRIRTDLIEQMGPLKFRVTYSLIAFGTLGPAAVITYTNPDLGPVLYQIPHWVAVGISAVLMFFAVQLFVLALAAPSPVSLISAKAEARGVLRITRHPMNTSWMLFGLAHLVANGTLGDVVFFGCCFVIVGGVGAFHLDRRVRRRGDPTLKSFYRETSIVPMAAVLTGRQRLQLSELPWPMLVLGVIIWAALLVFHGRLIGAPLF